MIVTRFAPSPTGYLHLGHAFSALKAFRFAAAQKGRFLLRIEDIDPTRCKPIYIDAIKEDLRWLGLSWEEPVRLQSEHGDDYAKALKTLDEKGLLYPCFCTRQEIQAEVAAALSAPQGPDGPVYPGTCRHLSAAQRKAQMASGQPFAVRLDMAKACALAGALEWEEEGKGRVLANPQDFGDIVLARKECATSYHLSVTVDDALQGVTDILRGQDLFAATALHRLLQKLLGLPVPRYHHHPLLRGSDGRRLAKRDHALTLREMRAAGTSPAAIIERLGF